MRTWIFPEELKYKDRTYARAGAGYFFDAMPFIIAVVRQALAECQWNISNDQTEEFVHVLTSPALHEEAA